MDHLALPDPPADHILSASGSPLLTPLSSIGNLPPPTSPSKRPSFFKKFISSRSSTSLSSLATMEPEEEDRDKYEGFKADVFGYVPSFPVPPKYINTKTHRKKRKSFHRLFLAQELDCKTLPPLLSPTTSSFSSLSGSLHTTNSTTSTKNNKCAIWRTKFSLDGKFLATAGSDHIVRIWQVISTPEEREQYKNSSSISTITSIPTYNTFNAPTTPTSEEPPKKRQTVSAPIFIPTPIREYRGHTADILDLSWSKNNFLLSSSKDKTVHLWHPKIANSIHTFMHSDFVTSVEFHPLDDRFFVSGSLDRKLQLWNIPEKTVECSQTLKDLVMAINFSPDGLRVVAGCFNGDCLFFETVGLKFLCQMLVKSSHGKNAKGSKITGIEVTDYKPSKKQKTRTESYRLLVTTNDSRIRMYNFDDHTLISKFKGHKNHEGLISASFTEGATYAISGSEDNRTYIWNIEPEQIAGGELTMSKTRDDFECFQSSSSVVTTAIFAPNATRELVYASRDPIYDIADPPPVILTTSGTSAIKIPPYKVNPLDGNIIITTDEDGMIKVFRQDSGYKRRKQHLDTAVQVQKKKIALTSPRVRQDSFQHSTSSNRTSPASSMFSNSTTSNVQLQQQQKIPTLDLNDEILRCKTCGSNDFRARSDNNQAVILVCKV